MIQEIAPRRYDNAFASRREPVNTDAVLYFEGNQVLLREGDLISFPTVGEICEGSPERRGFLIYLFAIDETAYYLLPLEKMPELSGYQMAPVDRFRYGKPEWLGYAGITASQLYRWISDHKFCGKCGKPMRPSEEERAFCCDSCGSVVYPKISPAVIVAVTDGDRLLMSRYAGRPHGNYALIAGFTEIGETVEDTVRREVMEEVGLKVKNLRYYTSQPWSFSDSLLMGFYADLDGSPEITLDESELAEACWFSREKVPEPKGLFSLTGTMVDAFRKGQYPR
ncbi:NAD(+) diphosphatase [Cuneatibacter sp. NSJ-177]|uniref:NAD(+) diphosphatase n=1 Tax=Cuneatibacter sp. NSJ-177 TaxID=2931401 RepID=UPI001FD488DC|nr:NAD(+) diphosphatase [Cuneatibacter sp. NSJ-177]MCJ7834004.1 NAD(+) diphosphatase [Cuneatibacter sp. NSJ-177]